MHSTDLTNSDAFNNTWILNPDYRHLLICGLGNLHILICKKLKEECSLPYFAAHCKAVGSFLLVKMWDGVNKLQDVRHGLCATLEARDLVKNNKQIILNCLWQPSSWSFIDVSKLAHPCSMQRDLVLPARARFLSELDCNSMRELIQKRFLIKTVVLMIKWRTAASCIDGNQFKQPQVFCIRKKIYISSYYSNKLKIL